MDRVLMEAVSRQVKEKVVGNSQQEFYWGHFFALPTLSPVWWNDDEMLAWLYEQEKSSECHLLK